MNTTHFTYVFCTFLQAHFLFIFQRLLVLHQLRRYVEVELFISIATIILTVQADSLAPALLYNLIPTKSAPHEHVSLITIRGIS
jgi:hypothetical protein